MTLWRRWLLPVALLATACGGSGDNGSGAPDPAGASRVMTDTEIAALVYDPAYDVPSGFYEDERSATERSYTLHHVLDASGSYEVCTDDFAVASAWEDTDNATRSVQGYLVESLDNERYFEFVRELAYDNDVGNVGGTTSPGFARIFKCSHTNRDGVDRSLLTGFAGKLNTQPLSAESIRIFTEYLWQFAFFPASYKKVLDSYGSLSDERLSHTLVLALATRQGSDRCDLIEVANWQFAVDRNSGTVEKRFATVRRFEAIVEDSGIRICP